MSFSLSQRAHNSEKTSGNCGSHRDELPCDRVEESKDGRSLMKNIDFPVQESLLSQIVQAAMITPAEPFPSLSVPPVNGVTKRDGDLELLPGHLELPPGDAPLSLLSAQGEEKDSRLGSSCGVIKLGVPLLWETVRPGLLSVWWGINVLTDSRATMR